MDGEAIKEFTLFTFLVGVYFYLLFIISFGAEIAVKISWTVEVENFPFSKKNISKIPMQVAGRQMDWTGISTLAWIRGDTIILISRMHAHHRSLRAGGAAVCTWAEFVNSVSWPIHSRRRRRSCWSLLWPNFHQHHARPDDSRNGRKSLCIHGNHH